MRRKWGKRLYSAWNHVAPLPAYVLWTMGRPEYAQKRAFAFAKLVEPVADLFLGKRGDGAVPVRAMIMNNLLSRFSSLKPGFPLDIDLVGEDHLLDRLRDGRGALIATVHTQLALSAHGGLRVNGRSPLFVGFGDGDLRSWSWGSADRIERIHAADPTLFLKARSALEEGRVLVVFVDYAAPSGGATLISPNLFAWAETMQMPVLHMLALLDDKGRIRIELGAESGRQSGARNRARQFVAFVESRWHRRFAICRPKELAIGRIGHAPGFSAGAR